jgi:mono/diheme cytochrome c family protein
MKTLLKFPALQALGMILLLGIASAHAAVSIPIVDTETLACRNGQESRLPAPDSLYLQDYERVLYDFILNRKYQGLDWCVDKRVRDTGPWIEQTYYGVHPAVRIYYSPRMMYWLTGNPDYWLEGKKSGKAKPQAPRTGEVPDGAMIVKEMYLPPAEIYSDLQALIKQNKQPWCQDDSEYEKLLSRLITGYTVMIRDNKGSHDGWFWAGPSAPAMVKGKLQTVNEAIATQLDDYSNMPASGFGQPCIDCHASAAGQLTFSALKNIRGFLPKENLLSFRVDNSWRNKAYMDDYPLSILTGKQACLQEAVVRQQFELPPQLRPYTQQAEPNAREFLRFHLPPEEAPAENPQAMSQMAANSAFKNMFPQLSLPPNAAVPGFPKQWADHVVPGPTAEQYITSDNCVGCHGGLGGNPYDVVLFLQTGPDYGEGYNVSEYGEWRWSPMGLAGRDPIFYAQLESEMALLEKDAAHPGLLKGSLKDTQEQVVNTCESCHGSMGQRQLAIDAKTDKSLDPNFKVDYVYLTTLLSEKDKKPGDYAYHKYGELAREGISCVTCHHIDGPDPKAVAAWQPTQKDWINPTTPKELAYFVFQNNTGRFNTGPAHEFNGPFEKVATKPMENAIGITPKFNAFIRQSQMCGTCHTINLPNIGLNKDQFPVLTAAEQNPALKPYAHTIEQATFVEWQNSSFANQDNGKPGPGFKSCQDCHMPGGFESLDGKIKINQLTTKIATIEDQSYPDVDNLAPAQAIFTATRPDYKRHEHVGLNVFLLEMFNQFPDILGVAKKDYMTSNTQGNALAIDNMVRQAQKETVDLDVRVKPLQGRQLTVDVRVQNKTGHRFPSGVAFRRAFLEVLVKNAKGETVWASGRTDAVGVILNGEGQPLKTEFLPNKDTYQPHYQVITQQDQVQIYEELTQNADFEFTTSFIHRVHPIKDNRLLPKGWRSADYFKSQGEVMYEFMQATDPDVHGDPDYEDQGPAFPGADQLQYVATLPENRDLSGLSVTVTMYYQAIPPYFLNQRFATAPNGPATQRLYYLTSNLKVAGTAIENWKLPLVSKAVKVN